MRCAVIVLTAKGLSLAGRLSASPAVDCDIFLVGRHARQASANFPVQIHQGSLQSLTANLWSTYQGMVFICAVGIAVRVSAPLLRDKQTDPAVVVVDDSGSYAVSLLAGHWGGANELAQTVADVLGAAPVITTATDSRGLMGLDVFARRLDLTPEPFGGIKEANAAMVAGETVTVWCEPDPAGLERALGGIPRGLALRSLEEMPGENSGLAMRFVVTSQVMPSSAGRLTCCLRPRHLVVGVGCRRGTAAAEVLSTITHAFDSAGRSPLCISSLASVSLKEQEAGLHEAAAALGVPLRFFPVAEINTWMTNRPDLAVSTLAYEKLGVKAVCEPAAMMAASGGRLVQNKIAVNGVTVAIAAAAWPS